MSIDEICYKIIGAAMAVHRHFGPGYLEEVYKNPLMVELEARGFGPRRKSPSRSPTKGSVSAITGRTSWWRTV